MIVLHVHIYPKITFDLTSSLLVFCVIFSKVLIAASVKFLPVFFFIPSIIHPSWNKSMNLISQVSFALGLCLFIFL